MKTFFNMLLGIPKSLVASFILMKTWEWFIATKFGLPRLSLIDGVGLMFVVQLFFMPSYMANAKADIMRKKAAEGKKVDSDMFDIGMSLISIFLVYPFTLLGAYIWHQFQ